MKCVALFCAILNVRGTAGDEGIEETLDTAVEEVAKVGDGKGWGERIDSLVKADRFWDTAVSWSKKYNNERSMIIKELAYQENLILKIFFK